MPELKPNRPMMSDDMGEHYPTKRRNLLPWIVLVIIIAALGVGLFLFRDRIPVLGGGSSASTSAASGYQAVFLTNNQVYFGKIASSNDKYYVLRDIYYLQVVQTPPLQGSQQQNSQQQNQLTLVKLGNELHGPVDEMHINRDQVLFWEDMKGDSNVVKAILADKENAGKKPADSTAPKTPAANAPAGTSPAQSGN